MGLGIGLSVGMGLRFKMVRRTTTRQVRDTSFGRTRFAYFLNLSSDYSFLAMQKNH